MVKPADPQPPAAPPEGDPPAEGGPKLEDRVGALEGDVAETKGMVAKILERLPGGDPQPGPAPASGSGAPAGQPADIQSLVRQEIADAKERQAAEDRARGDADWRSKVDQTLESLKPEKPPREPQTGLRGRLQRATIGKQD
jgi:hypothetical protein